MTTTYLRHANLPDIAGSLQDFRNRSVDLVAGAGRISATESGRLVVADAVSDLTEDGVDTAPGAYRVSEVANEGIASKLNIPSAYARTLYAEHTALWAANVNGWMERDDRKFLVRTYGDPTATDGFPTAGWTSIDGGRHAAAVRAVPDAGIVRAFLSDSYRTIDNFDVVTAVLSGVQSIMDPAAVQIDGDLTERRLYLRLSAPTISTAAEALLKRYRAPSGSMGRDNPTVFAGLVVRNSEVGNGAFTITPRVTVQVCTNGLVVTKDAMREVHLGSKLDEGIVKWSADTERKNLALITSQTADAVRSFLNGEYLDRAVAALTETAESPVRDAPTTIARVAGKLGFSKTQADSILAAFIDGADSTAGGVMQAMTAVAGSTADGDAAFELESKAVAGMELAATR